MKYSFKNILGDFILDAQLDLVGEGKKYPGTGELPLEKIPRALLNFKEKKFFEKFYRENLKLTKKAIKESVSADALIIQAIANVTELERTCNLLAKRLREWYGLYLPELKVEGNENFVKLILKKNRPELMKEIKAKETMGADLSKSDAEEIIYLAQEVSRLFELKQRHEQYLEKVMQKHCPNMLSLAGVTIGAKLLELGKGLKHLALLPASTIQLLGAEKALFRHLKTGSRSPKFGIIHNHQLVQKAKHSQRGKMARRLADKLSLCCRLDYFKGEFKAEEYRKELEGKVGV